MVQKKISTSFPLQIRKLLKDVGFCFTAEQDGTPFTIIDSKNMTVLRPKPSIPEFLVSKREIEIKQQAVQKHKKTKEKLISVFNDSENTVKESSVTHPTFI